jgi:site-specific recombinase XerD
VRRFLADLHDQGHVSEILVGALEYVKEPKLLPRALQHEQMRALLQTIDTTQPEGHRDRTMLELLYSSGLRAAELLGLDVDGVDFEHQVVTVMGKGRKERVVPVGATALRFLEGYLRAVRPALVCDPACRALFVDAAGKRLPYHTLRRIVLATGAEAGLLEPLTAHMFRRSCTSELVRGNANLYHVSRMLGHESLDTLRHYVRLNIADIQKTHRQTHPRERDEKSRGEDDPQPQPQ